MSIEALIRFMVEDSGSAPAKAFGKALDDTAESAQAAQSALSGYDASLDEVTRRMQVAADAESKTAQLRQTLSDRQFTRAQDVAQAQIRALDEVAQKETSTEALREELENRELIRATALANVNQQEARARRDKAVATEESAIRQEREVASLSGLARASVEYSTAVANATQGTTGFATTLGHLGVATQAISEGGMTGMVAAADLAQMAYGAIVPVLKHVAQEVVHVADEFAGEAKAMGNAAIMAGASLDSFSGLSDAIKLMGDESGVMQNSLRMMSFRMKGALETTGEMQGAVSRFGISLFDANGNIKSSTDLMYEYADIFQKMPDGPQKTAAAMEVFGRSGASMLPMLSKGSQALKAQAQLAKSLGASYTQADADIGKALKKAEARVDLYSDATDKALGRAVTPLVITGYKTLGDIAEAAFMLVADSASKAEFQTSKLMTSTSPGTVQNLSVAMDSLSKTILTNSDTIAANKAKTDEAIASHERWAGILGISNVAQATDKAGINAATEALQKNNIEQYETMTLSLETLKQKRASFDMQGQLTAAEQLTVNALDKAIVKGKEEIAMIDAKDKSLARSIELKKKENELGQEGVVAKNVENKATADAEAVHTALFNERAKLMAAERTAQDDLTLAVLRSNLSVIESEKKLAADRATVDDQMKNSAINSAKSVFDETVKFAQLRANAEDEMAKAIITADEGIVKAQQAFRSDRATVDQQMKSSAVAAEKAIFDEAVKFAQMRQNAARETAKAITVADEGVFQAERARDNDRATRPQQLAMATVAAERAIDASERDLANAQNNRDKEIAKAKIDSMSAVEKERTQARIIRLTEEQAVELKIEQMNNANTNAEIANRARLRTVDQEVKAERIAMEGDIIGAHIRGVELIKNADLSAARAVAEAEAQTGQARQALFNRQLTRTETLKQANIHAEEELQGKLESNDALRSQISNKTLIALTARQDGENAILTQKKNQVIEEQKAAYFQGEGAQLAAQMGVNMGAVAGATASASASASSFADGMGQASAFASATASSMTAASVAAQSMAAAAKNIGNEAPFGQGSYAGASSQTKWTFGKHTFEVSPRDPSEFTLASGAAWTNMNLAGIAAAKAADEWDKEQEQIKQATAERKAQHDKDHPAEVHQREQQAALEAKRKAIADVQNDAGFNQQMKALDDQLALVNKRTDVGSLASRSGTLNELDLLGQQEAIINAQRQAGNFGALSGGMDTLDALSQRSAIQNASRQAGNFGALSGGQDTLDLLGQTLGNLTSSRQLANSGAMAPGLNQADVTALKLQLANAQRQAGNSGATDPIKAAIDALAKAIAANPPTLSIDGRKVTGALAPHISGAISGGQIPIPARVVG